MKFDLKKLETDLSANADLNIASDKKVYLRNQFEFYGIMASDLKYIMRPFLLKSNLPEKEKIKEIVETVWQKPQREFQYFGMELAFRYKTKLNKEDIDLYAFMVINKAWWDTVDFIAVKLMGTYFKTYPQEINKQVDTWLSSGNIWLQRSALLFQLKYKDHINKELLAEIICSLLGSNEFFINKAIGWTLCELSKTHPQWVRDFADGTNLSNLSRREALRLMN